MQLPKQANITPLWIIGGFLAVTETVALGVLPFVSGAVQYALTCFVLGFPVLVAAAFFTILWNKPYVLYPPSEYGHTDPSTFVHAMQTKIPDHVAEQIREVESRPKDLDAQFALIDSLIDQPTRQHLVLMCENDVRFPYSEFNFGYKYETGGRPDGSWHGGGFSATEMCRKLDGTGLIQIAMQGPSITLTEKGIQFAKWLIRKGRKADFFRSPLGEWGTPVRPQGLPQTWEVPVPEDLPQGPVPLGGMRSVDVQQPQAQNQGDDGISDGQDDSEEDLNNDESASPGGA